MSHNDSHATAAPAVAGTAAALDTTTTTITRPGHITLPPNTNDSIPHRLSGFESHPVSPTPTVCGVKTPLKAADDKEKGSDRISGYFDESRSPSYGSLNGLGVPYLAHDAPLANDTAMSSNEDARGRAYDEKAIEPASTPGPDAAPPCPPVPVPGFTELERAATFATLDNEGYVRMTKPRMAFLTFAMLMTYFLGTASSTAPTLLIPSIARDLGSTELETQWVSALFARVSIGDVLTCRWPRRTRLPSVGQYT